MSDVMNAFKVAGVVLGSVAGVFVLGVGGWVWLRRRGALRGE